MRLRSAVAHYRRQQRILTAALAKARRYWASGDLAGLAALVTLAQQAAAQDASGSVPLMLAEQGAAFWSPLSVVSSAFAGVASDGRGLVSLFEQASTRRDMQLMVATQVQDAARVAAGVAIATRPEVTGYVRMLNPPSCSRCVILAGKWFRWNTGFERHPKCDCRHIPAAEDTADELRTDPRGYFESLSPEQQANVFGKAAAQAIRDGADLAQVVNARRGMSVASIGGRRVLITSEGTTRRGLYGSSRRGRPRLMPEQIYAITGDDRAEALRLLEANGYILGSLAAALAA